VLRRLSWRYWRSRSQWRQHVRKWNETVEPQLQVLRAAYPGRGTRRAGGSVIPHRPVNLLPGHGASMSMKERGTRLVTLRDERPTVADFSFYPLLGPALEEAARSLRLPEPHRGSSFIGPTWSGRGTGTPGGSGGQREGADFDNRGRKR
jgi:hypothetical protein